MYNNSLLVVNSLRPWVRDEVKLELFGMEIAAVDGSSLEISS